MTIEEARALPIKPFQNPQLVAQFQAEERLKERKEK
jgi:hypothetical protein